MSQTNHVSTNCLFLSTFAPLLVRPDEFFVSTEPQGWRVTADWDSHCSRTCSSGSSAATAARADEHRCAKGIMTQNPGWMDSWFMFFSTPNSELGWWTYQNSITKKNIHRKKNGTLQEMNISPWFPAYLKIDGFSKLPVWWDMLKIPGRVYDTYI